MITKSQPDERVIAYLKTDEIINLNMLGILENEQDCIVYTHEDDKGIIDGCVIIQDWRHFVYTRSDAVLSAFMETLFKKGSFGFAGVHRPLTEKILSRGREIWRNPCDLYYMPPAAIKSFASEIERQEECGACHPIMTAIGPLDPVHAALVDSFYSFRDDESLEEIRKNITQRPSSAVFIDGEPAAWVMIHEDGSMGILFCREEYRGRGYGRDITLDLARKVIAQGKTPFVQILESNGMSPGLALKCGFVKYDKCDWFRVEIG